MVRLEGTLTGGIKTVVASDETYLLQKGTSPFGASEGTFRVNSTAKTLYKSIFFGFNGSVRLCGSCKPNSYSSNRLILTTEIIRDNSLISTYTWESASTSSVVSYSLDLSNLRYGDIINVYASSSVEGVSSSMISVNLKGSFV